MTDLLNTASFTTAQSRQTAAEEAARAQIVRDIRRHSLLVKVLKWILPVGCLAVIMMFLYSSGVLEEYFYPRAKEPVPVIAEKTIEMVQPRMSGLDQKSRAYELSALTAKQSIEDPSKVTLEKVAGALIIGGGKQRITMTAKTGYLDTQANFLKLREDIVVSTQNQQTAYLTSADVKLKEKHVITHDEVLIEWEGGSIRSVGMELKAKENIVKFMSKVKVHLNSRAGATGKKDAN